MVLDGWGAVVKVKNPHPECSGPAAALHVMVNFVVRYLLISFRSGWVQQFWRTLICAGLIKQQIGQI